MKPSGTMLVAAVAAVVICSSALQQALVAHSMPLSTAAVRLVVCFGVCWAGVYLVRELAFPGIDTPRHDTGEDPLAALRAKLGLQSTEVDSDALLGIVGEPGGTAGTARSGQAGAADATADQVGQ